VSKKIKRLPAERQTGPKIHYAEATMAIGSELAVPATDKMRWTRDNSDIGKRRGPKGYMPEARRLAREMLPTWTESDTALAKRIAEIIRINYCYQGADDPIISEEWIMRMAVAPEKRATKK
jgi:hypothetical protein